MNTSDLFNLSGKTALVTGCDRGIGQAMALALAAAGANIIGTATTDKIVAGETQQGVVALGRSFTGVAVDLSNRDGVYTFINKVLTSIEVDILVNNAGTILRTPATEHPDDSWDKVLAVNLDAQFILTREFGKRMIQRGYGKIVFTCSLLSFQGGINVPGYTASKSAVAGLVKAFANEWASKGVNVNGVAPGYIETKNTDQLRSDPERYNQILTRIPAARWGEPADLGGPTVFLCSRASDYVHGHVLLVDGGWMAR